MGGSKDTSTSSWGRPRRKSKNLAKEPSYQDRPKRNSSHYENRRRSSDSGNYRSRRDGSDGVVLHVPLPPKPKELNYIDKHGAHVQRIQPAEIDYPGSHHQRWYFFWPEKKCGPKIPMRDGSMQSNPYELREHMQVQTAEPLLKRMRSAMNQTSESLLPTRSLRRMDSGVMQTSQHSLKGSYSTYTVYNDENANPMISGEFDPKACPMCGRGRFMLQTTAAGYVTILLFFPIGMYAFLTKKCCAVERCSYCRYINTDSSKAPQKKSIGPDEKKAPET